LVDRLREEQKDRAVTEDWGEHYIGVRIILRFPCHIFSLVPCIPNQPQIVSSDFAPKLVLTSDLTGALPVSILCQIVHRNTPKLREKPITNSMPQKLWI
jgi:hypothetical protein